MLGEMHRVICNVRSAVLCGEVATAINRHLPQRPNHAHLQAHVRRHVRPLPQLEQIEPLVGYSGSLGLQCLIRGQHQSLGDLYCGEMRVFKAAVHSCIA